MIRVTKKHLLIIKRKNNAKKGDYGKVLIVGGSREYVGAPALAGLAAMRAGVDWVTIAAPEKVAWAINTLSPDLVTEKLPGEYLGIKHKKKIVELVQKHDVVLFGNGAGTKADTKKLFLQLAKSPIQKVLDADALKLLTYKDVQNAIVTPHTKEAKMFFKTNDIKEIQKKADGLIALVKGPTDYIISKREIYYNTTGNPGMAKAGTGDVLAGLCAGYLAQSHNMLKSAISAAYINGQIGDMLLKKRKGEYSFVASDLVSDYKKLKYEKKQFRKY